MKNPYELDNWEQFVDTINQIQHELLQVRKKNKHSYFSPPLFRGHADAKWDLETTLERKITITGFEGMNTMKDYQIELWSAYRYLSGFNDLRYEWDNTRDCTYEEHKKLKVVPNYEFMVYARHHGFPSPLLDWSASPYIAAFFAFDSEAKSDKVAIYSYQEMKGVGKATNPNDPQIFVAGPWAAAHRRHHLQQCNYTLCFQREKTSHEMEFVPYKVRYSGTSFTRYYPQDVVVKFTIPTSERKHALEELSRMNINSYSLYQSEEALVRTVADKIFFDFGR